VASAHRPAALSSVGRCLHRTRRVRPLTPSRAAQRRPSSERKHSYDYKRGTCTPPCSPGRKALYLTRPPARAHPAHTAASRRRAPPFCRLGPEFWDLEKNKTRFPCQVACFVCVTITFFHVKHLNFFMLQFACNFRANFRAATPKFGAPGSLVIVAFAGPHFPTPADAESFHSKSLPLQTKTPCTDRHPHTVGRRGAGACVCVFMTSWHHERHTTIRSPPSQRLHGRSCRGGGRHARHHARHRRCDGTTRWLNHLLPRLNSSMWLWGGGMVAAIQAGWSQKRCCWHFDSRLGPF
jgi:hypothetical protein